MKPTEVCSVDWWIGIPDKHGMFLILGFIIQLTFFSWKPKMV